ncbi:MAG: hypothetical protein WA213_01250 [Terriglobales bacterium]
MCFFKVLDQQGEQLGETAFSGADAAPFAVEFFESANAALVSASLRITAGTALVSRAAYSYLCICDSTKVVP